VADGEILIGAFVAPGTAAPAGGASTTDPSLDAGSDATGRGEQLTATPPAAGADTAAPAELASATPANETGAESATPGVTPAPSYQAPPPCPPCSTPDGAMYVGAFAGVGAEAAATGMVTAEPVYVSGADAATGGASPAATAPSEGTPGAAAGEARSGTSTAVGAEDPVDGVLPSPAGSCPPKALRMRGVRASNGATVHWRSLGSEDLTGAQSPFPGDIATGSIVREDAWGT